MINHFEKRKKNGFTLVELLIVISLVILLATMTISYSFNFYKNTGLQEDSEYILNALRRARSYSITGKENSDWGVMFFENEGEYIIFKGQRYTDRDQSFDTEFKIYSNFVLDFEEVVFEEDTGKPKIYGIQ